MRVVQRVDETRRLRRHHLELARPASRRYPARTEPFAISAVTYMELVQGMRNARELRDLQSDLKLWQSLILPITEAISDRATALVEAHFLSHNLQLADALIAATAIEHQLTLVTGNLKHFRAVKELGLQPFRTP